MKLMSKVGLIAGVTGKVAYAVTSLGFLAKSVGTKVANKLNYKALYYITIVDKDTGVIMLDSAKLTSRELIPILETFSKDKRKNVQIILDKRETNYAR